MAEIDENGNDVGLLNVIPSAEAVREWINLWKKSGEEDWHLKSYWADKEFLEHEFKNFPLNNELNTVHLKVALVNSLYNAGVDNTYRVAVTICSIKDFDEQLPQSIAVFINLIFIQFTIVV